MTATRPRVTTHTVPWRTAAATRVEYAGAVYALAGEGASLFVEGAAQDAPIGTVAREAKGVLSIKLTPGAQNYYEARAFHDDPLNEAHLIGAVIIAGLLGHPDAVRRRAGVSLSAVWSHHLAIAGGEDPRQVARTYAPTETKTISGDMQQMASVGVRVTSGV
jgi:hypothetical protein